MSVWVWVCVYVCLAICMFHILKGAGTLFKYGNVWSEQENIIILVIKGTKRNPQEPSLKPVWNTFVHSRIFIKVLLIILYNTSVTLPHSPSFLHQLYITKDHTWHPLPKISLIANSNIHGKDALSRTFVKIPALQLQADARNIKKERCKIKNHKISPDNNSHLACNFRMRGDDKTICAAASSTLRVQSPPE